MLTTDEFISRAIKKHGDRYDYSRVEYTGVNNKVEIECSIHGVFSQSYRLHVERGNGCPQCGIAKPKRLRITATEFFARAHKVHGEKYDYSNSEYLGAKFPINIQCKQHGEFTIRTARLHIDNKNGCPTCAHRLNTVTFIAKAEKLFGDFYQYDQVLYETVDTPVIIGCPKHGPQLKRNRVQDIWLDEIGVPSTKAHRQARLKVNDRLFIVDGMIDNTVYLFHGDYWHGNPAIYDSTAVNKRNGFTFGELFINTVNYENALRNAGYKVESIWEYDWLQGKRR